jgi:CubicO group peptidase (beta-lactamase class C family)
MSHPFSQPISRRAFLGAVGLGALTLRTRAQDAPGADAAVVLPSAYFGTTTPEAAGFSADLTARMSAFLQSKVDAGLVPGAFVAAMRNGKVFLEQHFGTFCDRTRRDAPYDGAAIHPFHSISKMVSATAVVMAWQDGLIDIDVPVMKYLPEFGNGGKEGITIRQLLTHSAGIPKTTGKIYAETEEQWKAAIAAICAEPVQWPPGSRTEYHALAGMLISAEAVRRASGGKTWNQICQERIFTPLGLTSFTFEEPAQNLPLACIPRVSDPGKLWQKELDGFSGQPAAGLKGSMTDLLKYLQFHSQNGVWKGQTLLQPKYWTEIHTDQFPGKPIPAGGQPGFESWGLGMMIRSTGPLTYGLKWFGLSGTTRPNVFSHVGTSIAMAVGDPDSDTQIAFIVTDNPKTKEGATELRDTVTGMVFNSLSSSPA